MADSSDLEEPAIFFVLCEVLTLNFKRLNHEIHNKKPSTKNQTNSNCPLKKYSKPT